MAINAALARVTTSQKSYLLQLLLQLELNTRVVTVGHRELFLRAGVAWREGQSLDALLDTLSKQDASNLITELEEETGDDR